MNYNPVPEHGFFYRVLNDGECLTIRYIYHQNHQPVRLSTENVVIAANDVETLRKQLKALNEATMLPIINLEDIKPIEGE